MALNNLSNSLDDRVKAMVSILVHTEKGKNTYNKNLWEVWSSIYATSYFLQDITSQSLFILSFVCELIKKLC